MEQMWLDILYVIPTGVTPHKDMKGDATAKDRLEMCRLAFAEMDGVIVSDLEMRREGKSYTVDTLRELYDPAGRLFLLMGTDMLLTLDKWREPEEIFKLCYPVYIRREEDAALDGRIVEKITSYQEKFGKVVRRVVAPAIELSSSDVREAIAKGQTVDGMIPPAVARYIETNQLYRTI
jgi:nicotinate-nucleotide adenylyltransferase